MNFLYTCDNNYVWLMIVSLISLYKTNKENELTTYLIGENISKENKEMIMNVSKKYNQKCVIIDLPKLDLPSKLGNNSRWPKSAYTRLFSAQILPKDIDKILYIDCDTIIKSDLKELFQMKMEDNKIFYGVKDCISKEYKKNIGLNNDEPYINAGVLFINLNLLRNEDMKLKIENFVNKYDKFIYYADQDLLNGIYHENIGILKPNYDVMTIEFAYSYKDIQKLRSSKNYYLEEEINDAVTNPYIIHYTTNMLTIRPWFLNSNHPRKKDFIDVYEESPNNGKDMKVFKMKGLKNRILWLLLKLPKYFRYDVIGFIHSKAVPKFQMLKGKLL